MISEWLTKLIGAFQEREVIRASPIFPLGRCHRILLILIEIRFIVVFIPGRFWILLVLSLVSQKGAEASRTGGIGHGHILEHQGIFPP
jgi:hypothetical protein